MTMLIVSKTARSVLEQARREAMRKREAAGTLATAFPRSKQVRIHLKFVSRDRHTTFIPLRMRTSISHARTGTVTAAST